jgi:hypothetical protein
MFNIAREQNSDFRLMACETWAISERELLERVADLESERDVYRQMVSTLLAQCHDLLKQRRTRDRTIEWLSAERERLRVALRDREDTAA